jgi:Probable lipoprotein LpqN
MIDKARVWLAVAGAAAAGIAGVVGLSGASAGAEPLLPSPPAPGTVTQTVPAAPVAAPAVPAQPGLFPASPAVPAAVPTAAPTLVPAASGTLTDYFKGKGVRLEPQKAQDFKALGITLPMPAGWSQVPDPNVPDAFVVIANRNSGDLYTPNAAVVVYKLVGDFDPKEAVTHGFVDSQALQAWKTTDASLADFGGFPSALIEGSYRSNDETLNTSRRHVIATSGPDKYLVSLSVTTSVNQVVATAAATDAIVNGFRVTAPAPAPSPVRTP